MAYYVSRKLKMPFGDVIAKITQTLKQQGFGIITSIDLKETLQKKLNVNFRNYTILGACNPQFAYNAVSLESHSGVMLPCNVVVQEHENGEVEVSAINPIETIGNHANTPLKDIAAEVSDRLRTAVDDLHRELPEWRHAEALPTAKEVITAPGEE
jgi:uncharacterized protein (DUF302 family)